MHFSKPFPSISSAGQGLKSARVIQSVSRRVSFSIGACLYKLWNSHDFPSRSILCDYVWNMA